ncbi:helix-turn-helix domain-containing protein [Streptomyces griseoloalbus]
MQHARRFLYRSGGVRLTPQTRAERHLSGSEREEISRGIAAGQSARQLAKRLGRSPSTVSREQRCSPVARPVCPHLSCRSRNVLQPGVERAREGPIRNLRGPPCAGGVWHSGLPG